MTKRNGGGGRDREGADKKKWEKRLEGEGRGGEEDAEDATDRWIKL